MACNLGQRELETVRGIPTKLGRESKTLTHLEELCFELWGVEGPRTAAIAPRPIAWIDLDERHCCPRLGAQTVDSELRHFAER